MRETVSELRGAVDLQGRTDRNPYGTVAAALGIGYVLGGGLFTPLTAGLVRLALRLGLRFALLPVLKNQLLGGLDALEETSPSALQAGKNRHSTTTKRKQTKGGQ